MKKFIIPIVLILLGVYFVGSSCSGPSTVASNDCSISDTRIEDVFSDLTMISESPMDSQEHHYTFSSNVNGQICAIGYQSLQQTTPYVVDNSSVTYTITIENGPSVTQTFPTGSIEYVDVTPFDIVAGEKYTIKRVGGDGLNSSMGHTKRNADLSTLNFPITQGNITFYSSEIKDTGATNGTTLPNKALPRIYFKFLEQ